MAPSAPPPDLKPLVPFIRRAEELEKDTSRPESATVAYYCRQYAMELGMTLRESAADPEAASSYLLALIERLEATKASLGVSRDEGEQTLYAFASEVFSRADAEDRSEAGASKATARTFYAASVFFDALKQFGERGEETDEKCRYAKWKAADILKAFKEGRKPAPGGPSGLLGGSGQEELPQDDAGNKGDADDDGADLPRRTSGGASGGSDDKRDDAPSSGDYFAPAKDDAAPPAYGGLDAAGPPAYGGLDASAMPALPDPSAKAPTAPSAPAPSAGWDAPPPQADPGPPPQYVNHDRPATGSGGARAIAPTRPLGGPAAAASDAQIEDALEYCRFAIAALEIRDVNLAIQRLQGALGVLQ